MSRAEFARALGVSKAAVTQGIGRGRLKGHALTNDGKVRLGEAMRQWRGNADPRHELQQLAMGQAPAGADTDDDADPGYRDHKAREARLRADKLQIEIGIMEDRYRDVHDLARAVTTCGRRIRDRIDGAVGWAEQLAALPAGDVGAMRVALRALLRELQDSVSQQLRNLGDEDGEDA